MAAAAETLINTQRELDYDREFNEIVASLGDVFEGYDRPPEAEIYGRSLSTIHRLGAFMVDKSLPEIISSPEADQARVEFYTSVEEGFGTDMELGGGLEVRDFDTRGIIDGKTMSKDLKTAVSDMTEAGLVCAKKSLQQDTRFKPQFIRSVWDHQNALAVDSMARGETDYNTRIVVSPFPEEAAAKSGDAYWRGIGYVPHLRRGFVQMFHADGEVVISGSLSFDGSNKKRLREVFQQFGKDIPEDEITDNWLRYAITDNLSAEEAKTLATAIADMASDEKYKKTTNTVDITRNYKAMVDQVFDSSYVHICESLFRGCQTDETAGLIHHLANQAAHFNERYSRALYRMRADKQKFSDDDSVVLHELLVYSTIEMLRAFHLKKVKAPEYTYQPVTEAAVSTAGISSVIAHGPVNDMVAFQAMLAGFGADGAKHGRAYSACGLVIAPGSEQAANPQTAFGLGVSTMERGDVQENSVSEYGEDKYGPLEFKCKNGHWNIRPRNELITQCRIKSCKNSVAC